MQRKEPLITGQVYHITTKSIAKYRIFNSDSEYARMKCMIRFFSYFSSLPKFSEFHSSLSVKQDGFENALLQRVNENKRFIRIIAYCIMPTHIHLVVEQMRPNGISIAVGNILNAYARYFNVKHKRRGPLWVGRFRGIPVSTDEQLLHLTRYVHLNPVSAGIVSCAEDWEHSSHMEYVNAATVRHPFCDRYRSPHITEKWYKKFVDDHASHQKDFAIIKHLIEEEA